LSPVAADAHPRVNPVTAITTRLANNAPLIRAASWPLVRFMPTLVLRKAVIVTGHAEVSEVLARDTDFTVEEVNATSMDLVNGPFILGMDRSPLYLRERSILQRSIEPGDPDRIRATVRRHASELVEAARPSGRIDVVQQLARPAAVRLVAEYFGVPGPDEPTMMHWMRTMFYETFLNIGEEPSVRRTGEASGAAFHAYADELIAGRKAQVESGEPTPDDLVCRLLRMQADPDTCLSDEGVRRNLGGVVVGAVDTTSKAVAHAVYELLRRPADLDEARVAARAGDIDKVARYAFEALRFNPLNPILARHAARDETLAAGTRRARRIPSGRTVYVAILSAMFDPKVFDQPGQFRPDRPADAYLHFGGGLHTCFGRYVNLIQIPELVAAVVRLHGLRFAGSGKPAIRYDGPFPDELLVEFNGSN
jgi:cytochrome P450